MTKISKITVLTALITLAFGMTVIGNAVAGEPVANTARYNEEIKVYYAADGGIIEVKALCEGAFPKNLRIKDKDKNQLPADLSFLGYPFLDIINANLLRVHGSPGGCYIYNPRTGRWICICCP